MSSPEPSSRIYKCWNLANNSRIDREEREKYRGELNLGVSDERLVEMETEIQAKINDRFGSWCLGN